MINIVTVDLRALPSELLASRRAFPMVSAVYFAISAEGEVLYVGQTRCLWKRWQGWHHRMAELAKLGSVRIAWLVLDENLSETEQAFIDLLKPVLNGSPVPAHEHQICNLRDIVIDRDLLADKCKVARSNQGLTQTEVGRAVGVQKAAISKMELGKALPSADVLARLCKLYELQIADLSKRAA